MRYIVAILLFSVLVEARSQEIKQSLSTNRAKDNLDFGWQFHKGDIAIKKIAKSGRQGEISGFNVKMVSAKDTSIDYTNPESGIK